MKVNLIVRLIYSLPVWIIASFHLFGMYVFVNIFCKDLVEQGWLLLTIVLLLLFLFLCLFSLWSLLHAYWADPGEVAPDFHTVSWMK